MRVTINTVSTTTETQPQNGTGGLNAFFWFQIFALDTAVGEAQNVQLALWLPNYCNVSPWRNNLIKLTYYVETKIRAHNSQVCPYDSLLHMLEVRDFVTRL